jgi:hypothetical protein
MTQPNPEIIATLEPCPFCGAPASIIRANPGFDYPWFVAVKHKRSCEIALTDHCSRTSHKTRAAAIRRWNTRAAYSTIQPQLEKMREALRELVAKLDECERPLRDVFALYYAHGGAYNGPSYFDELKKARALLTPLEQREDCQ